MSDLTQDISELTDREAIQSANYVAEWMQRKLAEEQSLPAELEGTVTDDQAVTILSEEFPDLSASIQNAALDIDDAQRGQIARNLLQFLSEDDQYAPVVQEALDQLIFKFDPVTVMAVGAGIVFLLSLKFEFEDEIVDGKHTRRWKVSREATPTEVLQKILSFGATG